MLTVDDLDNNPEYAFDYGDRVKFFLNRGLELITCDEPFKSRQIRKSSNRNSNRSFTGEITSYGQATPNRDLSIEGVMADGYKFRLRLNQCRDLKILD